MSDFRQRLAAEKVDLDERLYKLWSFIDSEACQDLPVRDQLLLREQAGVMERYTSILGLRLLSAATVAGEG